MSVLQELLFNRALPERSTANRLLGRLPDDAFALIEADLRHLSLPQGHVCFAAGDPIDQVYFPQSGLISLLVVTGAGDMVETSLIGREGAAGLQAGYGPRQSLTRGVVQIGGKFSIISAARFEQATSRSVALRTTISRYIELQWAEAQQIATCNAIHDGASRLCRWLLQSADRIGSDHLLLTQELLSDMLGVRRTTITLLAQELQKSGLIRYRRGRISILDRAALERRACECYYAVKQENLCLKLGLKL